MKCLTHNPQKMLAVHLMPPKAVECKRFDRKKSRILGLAQIVIGITAIICNIITIGVGIDIKDFSEIGYGIWNGVLVCNVVQTYYW